MPTPTTCYPWWHAPLLDLTRQPWAETIIPSGCGIVNGDATCSPEQMRATSEQWLRAKHPAVLTLIGGSLPLRTYTFARYMHSEVGSGTIEERVAVGEAALGQGKLTGRTIEKMLTPTGFYGPIHASEDVCIARNYARGTRQNKCGGTANPKTCCSPFNRWASTARDPSLATLVIAHYVVTGQTGNFANDAVTQWGPEAWIKEGQARLDKFVEQAANQGLYWVGPLPGVDPFHTFLTAKIKDPGPARAYLIQRGKDALRLPRQRFTPPTLSSCGPAPSNGGDATPSGGDAPRDATKVVLAVAGLILGGAAGWAFNRWRFPTTPV